MVSPAGEQEPGSGPFPRTGFLSPKRAQGAASPVGSLLLVVRSERGPFLASPAPPEARSTFPSWGAQVLLAQTPRNEVVRVRGGHPSHSPPKKPTQHQTNPPPPCKAWLRLLPPHVPVAASSRHPPTRAAGTRGRCPRGPPRHKGKEQLGPCPPHLAPSPGVIVCSRPSPLFSWFASKIFFFFFFKGGGERKPPPSPPSRGCTPPRLTALTPFQAGGRARSSV